MTVKMRLKMKNRSHRSRHKQIKVSQMFESVLNQSNVSQYISNISGLALSKYYKYACVYKCIWNSP